MNFESAYQTRYSNLNNAQQQAVDTTEGPVMVVAGPGTGKTELLSMRAANILRQTDALPENILCLTFTDSGSVAMQKRLTDIVGRDAYNISIFTFHAFGSEIMSRYREYFYRGAQFRPADSLNQHEIVTRILDSLEPKNPLRSTMNGQYIAINDILKAISDLKRSGLTDGELVRVLDANGEVIERVNALIAPIFSQKISAKTYDDLQAILPQIQQINEAQVVASLPRLSPIIARSLERALDEAGAGEKIKTPPLTAWKTEWCDAKTKQLKLTKQQEKLRALSYVYAKYLEIMQTAELFDFDDMIMQVVHAIELHDDLRYELQEKYQYIMVDEFQDTNMAQMRILYNLTNNPVVEDTPNIMVVGDDDQAIYGFQGADISNIMEFRDRFAKTTVIPLTDNYRSVGEVLTASRNVITQGEDRLELRMTDINLSKKLTAHREYPEPTAELVGLPTASGERQWLAESIKTQLETVPAHEIAVLARGHSTLTKLVPYLSEAGVSVSYDKRDNVLDDEVIEQLELLAQTIIALYEARHDDANAALPQLLGHPAWDIAPETLWQVSLTSYQKCQPWLEYMRTNSELKPIFEWFVQTAQLVPHLPLEQMLDILLGVAAPGASNFVAPYYEYFYGTNAQSDSPHSFVAHLENLTVIRSKLRDHDPDGTSPRLGDFVQFIAAHRATNTHIASLRHLGDDNSSVRLMTAHASKGLEFDTVYIVDSVDTTWGQKARGKSPLLSFPDNLRVRASNNTYDERLRLYYVAMTRAKRQLYMSFASENDNNKEMLRAEFLAGDKLPVKMPVVATTPESEQANAAHEWYAPIIQLPHDTMDTYLRAKLDTYKLSATDINAFVDVTHGGPQSFLLNNLLRFPHAKSSAASYGTAIHAALQHVHDYMRAHHELLPIEDVVHYFEQQLAGAHLSTHDNEDYLQQGADSLRAFFAEKAGDFHDSQRAEVDFRHQEVIVGQARLTGKLDVAEFDKDTRQATVTDYKTGGALPSWDKGTPYQKIKAYKYRQQLLFYKLLVENSREWRDYTMQRGVLQFVEPDKDGDIMSLELADIEKAEVERFTQLAGKVWQKIQTLDFPDTSAYSPDVDGIQQFEDDLLAGTA